MTTTPLMPTLFVSHGAPTFALEPGLLGPQLTALGAALPRPRAVLVVSPHWMTRDVQLSRASAMETIHDFGGFPSALYELQYPAAGAPDVADQAIALLQGSGWQAKANEGRGLDHGAWVPMRYLFAQADVPVLQASMPHGLDAASAYAFGQALAPLREQGVFIVGSGSLTHNLYEISRPFGNDSATEGASYAREFAAWARETLLAHDHAQLQRTMELAPHAQRAHPTTDHLLPLMVAAGAAGTTASVQHLDGGITYGVLSMDSYVFGAQAH